MNIQGKTASEIFECVRSMIQARQLRAGDSLPPVRELAVALGVNRNTVASAYRRLVTSGIAFTQGRLGTIIRDPWRGGEQEGAAAETPLVDLADGNPNPAWLPDLGAALGARPYQPRLYGAPTVNPTLESHVRRWFAPDCPTPFEVDLTHGAVDAIERLLALELMAGDPVAVETPCFLSSINLLRNARLRALGVPVDGEGMQVEALEAALAQGARAVILTPRAHNPTGCSLSGKRARALSRVLARHPNVLVIVDDHFSLLSKHDYHSVLPRNAGRWALVRSFSKLLGPDIRVAAVASDASSARQLRQRLAPGTNWVSHLLQDVVEAAVTDPDNIRLLEGARADYVRRRQALEAALLAEGIACAGDGDGLNLWVPMPAGDREAAQALARVGWLVRHGDAFALGAPAGGLRITTARIEPEQCRRLAADLARILA
ncbi:transcriptional regulator PtsJ [Massilia sp. IC2-477]|uniref:MocR-like B6 salvage transcription factor PtsJ n=1 Tax=Massilia sp. IC2-477 TaxID=2887198 RepID=UPI001D105E98|nr:transcriptional regulator PtsJ [Massilia sp. IC2-477]MCC2957568.1 transcriptional regulator PtsJ [Massilia sp. IC2-477]